MKTHPSYNINRTIHRYQDNAWSVVPDTVVAEKSISISVNGAACANLVCSPWDLKDIAIGYLCSEGLVKKLDDLKNVTIDEESGRINFEIEEHSSDALSDSKTTADVHISPENVLALASRLEAHSDLFRQTGGVHCAAIASPEEFYFFAEDIGRHNTLDRLYGKCFQNQIFPNDKILVFSGRISSEILLKTAKMGCPVLLSRSAPTDLALTLAEEHGITVIGFARSNRFNVYTHPERVV